MSNKLSRKVTPKRHTVEVGNYFVQSL